MGFVLLIHVCPAEMTNICKIIYSGFCNEGEAVGATLRILIIFFSLFLQKSC